jgi:hypothetical protein
MAIIAYKKTKLFKRKNPLYKRRKRKKPQVMMRGVPLVKLSNLILRGIHVEACKTEWKRRTGVDYPGVSK